MSLVTKFQAHYNTHFNITLADNFSNNYGKTTVTNETKLASSIRDKLIAQRRHSKHMFVCKYYVPIISLGHSDILVTC
jgi:hypothetical protein